MIGMSNKKEFDQKPVTPSAWKSSPGESKIQVHDPTAARKVARIASAKLSGASVSGPYLRLFTVPWPISRTRHWVKRNLGNL